jgi:hypothetical protein
MFPALIVGLARTTRVDARTDIRRKTMKTIHAGLLALLVAAGCGGSTTRLAATPQAPAAVGEIKVKSGDNDNTVGTLTVKHLAPPDRLAEKSTVYVAWVRPTGRDDWQNIGQLQVDDDREGTLDMVVPFREFDVSVTAEEAGDAQRPRGMVVLEGQVDR